MNNYADAVQYYGLDSANMMLKEQYGLICY